MKSIITKTILLILFFTNSSLSQDYCTNPKKYYGIILKEISKKNPNIIENLPNCLKQDRDLIFNALLIDPSQFSSASDILHQDRIFIKRALKANSEILKYVTPEIKSDKYFMEEAIYINRESLKYCSWSLLDNKLFMKKMINLDSENYKFASDRLKSLEEFAKIAFEDDGALLKYAPTNVKSNIDLVKIAINSNKKALEFASEELKSNPELIKIAEDKYPLPSTEILENFLTENYVKKFDKKNLGNYISNKGKFAPKQQLIDRNFIVKWKRKYNFSNMDKTGEINEEWILDPVEKRNYGIDWQDDFRQYPELSNKIQRFYATRRVAPEIISDLRTTFLWKIKDNPLTLAFNLYSLSPTNDNRLFNSFSNATSLTAIAQLKDAKWVLSVIDVIFNREIKVDTLYPSGHKKFIMWDIYKINQNDNESKIIFKVEDALSDHFEIFQEQPNGKYRRVFISKPIQGLDN